MKIFRFKVIVDKTERILSIGVISEKYNKIDKINGFICDIETINSTIYCKFKNKIDTNLYKYVDYSFAYAITNVGDKFNLKQEGYRLDGRIKSIKYCEMDCEFPTELHNNRVMKALATSYAYYIKRTVISKFKDIKGKDIKLEEYDIKDLIIKK